MIQDKEKVYIMRAQRILENNNKYCKIAQELFPTHFDFTLTEADKQKCTPCLLEKYLSNDIGGKPVSL